MHREVVEITLEEFTKITGDVEKLRSDLHTAGPLADAHRALLQLSPDPVHELTNLRNKVGEKSAEILKLREELDLLQSVKTENVQRAAPAKLRKDVLISSVLETKPELTSEERNFLHLILPIVDKVWTAACQAAAPVINPLEEKLKSAEGQIATLKDILKKNNEEVSKLKMKNEGLEGNVEALQSSLEFMMAESESLRIKAKQFEENQDVLMSEVRLREEELEQCRHFAKEKYDLELENRELELQLEKTKRNCEALQAGMEELAIHGVNTAPDPDIHLREEAERLRKLLKETQSQVMQLQQVNSALAEKLAEAVRTPSSKDQAAALQRQLKLVAMEMSEVKQQLEDAQSEKQILLKRHAQEIKELRQEVLKEKTAKQEALKALEDCKAELYRTQEVKMLHAKIVSASAREKTIVESLYNRVNELEKKNKFLLVTMQHVEEVKSELIREKQRSTQLSEDLLREKQRNTQLAGELQRFTP